MRLSADGTLRLSPSDLGNHLACPHLTQLELRVQRGELVRPFLEDPYGKVIRDKGNAHELAYLERLEAEGKTVARMPVYEDEGFDSAVARRLTEEAIRAGEADSDVRRVAWRHLRYRDRSPSASGMSSCPTTSKTSKPTTSMPAVAAS